MSKETVERLKADVFDHIKRPSTSKADRVELSQMYVELSMIDAPSIWQMEGKLTQAHIDAGVKDSCTECALALCLQEMVEANPELRGRGLCVEVSQKGVIIHDGSYTDDIDDRVLFRAMLTGLVQEWVDTFDRGGCVCTATVHINETEDQQGKGGWLVFMEDLPDWWYIDKEQESGIR